MNVRPEIPALSMLAAAPPSRKLSGLLLVLGALLIVLVLGIACWALFGIPEQLFTAVVSGITGMGIGHQTAQASADRSEFYPNKPPLPPAE